MKRVDNSDRVPWWLWWNILPFDATVVALAWQEVIGRTVGVDVPWQVRALLAGSVWCIYTIDRILDATRGGQSSTVRHRIASRTARAQIAGVAVVVWGCIFVLPSLDPTLFVLGAGLAVVAAVYLAFAPRLSRQMKEPAIGIIFAAGVALGPATLAHSLAVALPTTLLFALLATANTLMIATSEDSAPPPLARAVGPMLSVAALGGLGLCFFGGSVAVPLAAVALGVVRKLDHPLAPDLALLAPAVVAMAGTT